MPQQGVLGFQRDLPSENNFLDGNSIMIFICNAIVDWVGWKQSIMGNKTREGTERPRLLALKAEVYCQRPRRSPTRIT